MYFKSFIIDFLKKKKKKDQYISPMLLKDTGLPFEMLYLSEINTETRMGKHINILIATSNVFISQ